MENCREIEKCNLFIRLDKYRQYMIVRGNNVTLSLACQTTSIRGSVVQFLAASLLSAHHHTIQASCSITGRVSLLYQPKILKGFIQTESLSESGQFIVTIIAINYKKVIYKIRRSECEWERYRISSTVLCDSTLTLIYQSN